MANVSSYLEHLVRETHKTEAEVVAMALETGLKQLWREQILGEYLRGRITRDSAIEQVGPHWVDLADRQHKAACEDIEWATHRPSR